MSQDGILEAILDEEKQAEGEAEASEETQESQQDTEETTEEGITDLGKPSETTEDVDESEDQSEDEKEEEEEKLPLLSVDAEDFSKTIAKRNRDAFSNLQDVRDEIEYFNQQIELAENLKGDFSDGLLELADGSKLPKYVYNGNRFSSGSRTIYQLSDAELDAIHEDIISRDDLTAKQKAKYTRDIQNAIHKFKTNADIARQNLHAQEASVWNQEWEIIQKEAVQDYPQLKEYMPEIMELVQKEIKRSRATFNRLRTGIPAKVDFMVRALRQSGLGEKIERNSRKNDKRPDLSVPVGGKGKGRSSGKISKGKPVFTRSQLNDRKFWKANKEAIQEAMKEGRIKD